MRAVRPARFPLALLVPHVVVTAIALSSRSQTAWVLGRYSRALFLFNALNAFALLATAAAMVRGAYRVAFSGLAVLVLLTYVTGTNNELASAPFFLPAVLGSRLALGACCVAVALAAYRAADARAATVLLAFGSAVLTLTLVDAIALGVMQRVKPAASGGFAFRKPVDLGRIEPDAIAVVGDSFVYGVGVTEEQAFPAVLAKELGRAVPVYNLGLGGAGLPEYLAVLRRIPACDRAVVCFYMNDIPSRETAAMKLRQVLVSTGRTSFVLKLLADLLGVRMYPGAREYTAWVVADYDRSDPSFDLRWRRVTDDLSSIAKEARRGGRRQPILVLFPLMYDFARYPLASVHADLRREGEALGFAVVDMLPVFTAAFPDGWRHVARPDDTHFDAEVHAKVAAVLRAVLAESEARQLR